VAQSPLSQFLEEMKEITLRVPDDMVALIEQLAQHLEGVEIADVCDGTLTETDIDQCFRQAFMELKQDNVIRKPRDYAWIMMALEQNVIKDVNGFSSHQAYIDYLEMLGVEDVPGRTTLFRAYNLTVGTYPDWTFLDTPKKEEVLRRKNIIVRFSSAFMRAKRAIWNNK
jgi:hypothetical protein